MATSGVFTGSRTVTNGPQLRLRWEVIQTDITNNRSLVRLRVQIYSQYNINFSASKSGVNHGASFTYTGGMSGTGEKTVNTRDIWISHNSDGTKSQTFSASLNLNISWSTGYVSTITVSGTAVLDTIPRASSINSFSIGSSLQISTANTVNLSITRASTSFTHDISLRDGTTVIASWNGQGLPTSLNLAASQVNTLLSRMGSVTSKTVTLRVQTKSGSSNIGSAVTRTATATIHSNVTPTATSLSVSISGSGRDKTINKFVQNISRVIASFTATARGGASIVSNRIVVRRVSGGANSQTINSDNGTTGVVSLNGQYEVIATTTDSRGRVGTQRIVFDVEAYTPPRITSFLAIRNIAIPTTVNISRAGTHSTLGGDNPLTILIRKRQGEGSYSNVESTTSTSSSFSGNVNNTGNQIDSSYEFLLTITDSFGNGATSIQTISTQKSVFNIYQDRGVGVGKLWEQGALDVEGEGYINGHKVVYFSEYEEW